MHKQDQHADPVTGTVVYVSRHIYKVEHADQVLDCMLQPAGLTPAAGDNVEVFRTGSRYIIREVLPRRTVLARSDPRSCKQKVVAANADTLTVVASVKAPPLRIRLIDRCLVAARLGGMQSVICVNKADLLDPPERPALLTKMQPYVDLGTPVVLCSAATGEGIADLLSLLAGKLCVFAGHSGVGKSSLLNAIDPGLRPATNAVRKQDGKGRHTTTSSRLYRLPGEIGIIDTPGVREFGLAGVGEEELKSCFPEFADAARECRYRNCSHTGEPNCGVRLAVRDGHIPRARYDSYCRLMQDLFPERCGMGSGLSSFDCANCGASVPSEGGGTQHRNHCPRCLHSLHVDNRPGDRAACCGGVMEPVSVWVRGGGEWAIIHRCRECGALSSNRIASDDNEVLLMSLAVRPLSAPPFPLERLAGGGSV